MKNIIKHEVRLSKIKITNFRAFKNLELDLHENLTILIGKNSAGKSSILDCLAGNLKFFINKIQKEASISSLPSKTKNYFKIDDINIDAFEKSESSSNEIIFSSVYSKYEVNEKTKEFEIIDPNFSSLFSLKLEFDKSPNIRVIVENEEYDKIEDFIDNIRIATEIDDNYNIPTIVYYPNEYASMKLEIKKINPINIFSIYDDALDGSAFSFSEFANWYKWLYNKSKDSNTEDKTLTAIKTAILNMLNDDINSVYTDLRINYEKYPGEIALIKEDKKLSFNQLSSGEKSVMTLVADLARRLALANPDLTNPLDGQGIVLIDEIDLHLHPTWQRKIIPQLLKTFPNIQFVITTHSPLVLENTKPDNIRILQNNTIIEIPEFFPMGREIGEILEELMNENAVAIQKEIDYYFELISENKFKEAEKYKNDVLLKLTDKENPIFYQANAMISRKKLKQK